jgi:hypothetical protein
MSQAIKRTFFYIREDVNTPFYHEEGNKDYVTQMDVYAKAVDPRLEFSSGIISDKIHYFTLIHPDHDTFKQVTQNLYFNGDLKQEFKQCMRWTKKHKFAFALSASKIDVPVPTHYQLLNYYNIKTDEQNFVDATIMQKWALSIYDLLVGRPELYFTINFFDYTHNVKHVESRCVNVTEVFWRELSEETKKVYPTFMSDKKTYNIENNITHFDEVVPDVESLTADMYDTSIINNLLPTSLQNLQLPIFI